MRLFTKVSIHEANFYYKLIFPVIHRLQSFLDFSLLSSSNKNCAPNKKFESTAPFSPSTPLTPSNRRACFSISIGSSSNAIAIGSSDVSSSAADIHRGYTIHSGGDSSSRSSSSTEQDCSTATPAQTTPSTSQQPQEPQQQRKRTLSSQQHAESSSKFEIQRFFTGF